MKNMKSAADWFWGELAKFLQSRKLKQTSQRRLVIEHILAMNQHIDAESLYQSLKKSGHSIGLATIYRTLSLLREAGLVEQLNHAEGIASYELIYPGVHHDHMVCIGCGRIEEFESSRIEEVQQQIAKRNGFALKSHRLDLFGYCRSCAARGKR